MGSSEEKGQCGVLVLAGGGIDSTLCIHRLRADGHLVRALHIDYGQAARLQEWASVKRVSDALRIEASQTRIIPGLVQTGPEIVGRNAALVLVALLRCRPNEGLICLGVHAGTPYLDCSAAFVESIDRIVAEQTDSRVRVIAPLVDMLKPGIVENARSLGISIANTYSCQKGDDVPCGVCHSCRDREVLGC